MATGLRLRLKLFAAISLAVAAPGSAAPLESAVKAAYLYKMAAFVTWPPTAFAGASVPFRICVLGRQDIEQPLAQLVRGQRAWGRSVAVSEIQPGTGVSQCQVLFVGDGDVPLSDSAPVLTVSDHGSDSPQGVIEFTAEGNHVRFIIHREQAERRRLQLSSKLLNVAASVVP